MSSEPQDLYAVLGVPSTASPAQISHAYRDLLRRHHPDTRETVGARAADDLTHDVALRRLLAAYAVLRDPELRAEYDEHRNRRSQTVVRPQRHTTQPIVALGDVDWTRPDRPPWIAPVDRSPWIEPVGDRPPWIASVGDQHRAASTTAQQVVDLLRALGLYP